MVPSTYEDGTLYNVLPSGNKAPDETGNHNGYDQTRADFTFDRGNNLAATRVNADGLIEKGRENLLVQSNQFDTTWTTGSSLTSGQADKDGGTDAWLMTNGNIVQSITNTGVQTFSIYAKANSLDWVFMDFVGVPSEGAYFDIANGVIGTINSGSIGAKIESVGNGYYRCSIIINTSSATAVRLYTASADENVSGSGSVFIQNAQLEAGLVSTPYIETGATTAKAGILEDMPRIDYTSGTGALLLEGLRTNRVINSEYFDASEYNYVNAVTRTANAGTSPDGFNNAYLVTEDAVNGVHRIGQSAWGQNVEDTSVSIFAKSNGTRYIVLGNANMAPSMNTWFDLENGVVGTESNDIIDASIEPFENGWYRCSISYLPNKSNTYPTIYLANSDGGSLTYVGDGVSGVYLFGYQIEYGNYVSSYIPTYGSAVSRSADSCSVTGVSDVIDSIQGTIYFEGYSANTIVPNYSYFISLSDGTQNNRLELRQSGDEIQFLWRVGGTYQNNIQTTDAPITEKWKAAVKYSSSEISFYLNGSEVGNISSPTLYSANTLNRLGFDDGAGSNNLQGKNEQLVYFNEALSDSELATLTTL